MWLVPKLLERQVETLRRISLGETDWSSRAPVLRVRGKGALAEIARAVFNGRKRRIKAVLPKTVDEIWMEFGAVFGRYTKSRPVSSIDPVEEADAFIDYLRADRDALDFAPPYLFDLARFELSVYETKYSMIRSTAETPPGVERGSATTSGVCAIWEGDYNLQSLFQSQGIALDIPKARTTCLIWCSSRNGHLRIAAVPPKVATLLKNVLGGDPSISSDQADAYRALRDLGVLGDGSVDWHLLQGDRRSGISNAECRQPKQV